MTAALGRGLKPKTTAPRPREGGSRSSGWLLGGFCQRFLLLWKLLICVSYMFEIAFSNLENHKAAINKRNSGETPFTSTVHAFTSLLNDLLCFCFCIVNFQCSSTFPDVLGPLSCQLTWVYFSLLLLLFVKVIRKELNAAKRTQNTMK